VTGSKIKETTSTKPPIIRQRPTSSDVNGKIPVSEMEDRVNAYRRYSRLLYIVSLDHLDKYGELLKFEPTMHFAVFKKEYTSQGNKYRFVKALAPQDSPSALCETIDREICGKKNTSNGVNGTTFARHKTFQWDYSQNPVPSIDELAQNIII
jgi:hypothetical protein